KRIFNLSGKIVLLVTFSLFLINSIAIGQNREVNFDVYLWISEQPYNCTTMGSEVSQEFLQLLPNCPLSNSGQNDNPWPLSNTNFVNNGGSANSDWDISVDGAEFIFYVTPKITGDVSGFCEFDLTIKADSETMQINPPTEEMWIGSLFANESNTGFNDDNYNLEIIANPASNEFTIQVTPVEYLSEYNVQTDSTISDYLFKFSCNLQAPSYPEINSEIYIESGDIFYCDADGELSSGNLTTYSTEYINCLGDVTTSELDRTTGDGVVDIADLILWSCSYWAGVTGSYVPAEDYYAYKYDMGPTQNGYINSFPYPDNVIEFEDLGIFAMAFDIFQSPNIPSCNFSRTDPVSIKNQSRDEIDVSFLPDSIAVEVGDQFDLTIMVGNENPVDSLHGFELRVSYDHDLLELNEINAGAFLNSGVSPGGYPFSTFFHELPNDENGNIQIDVAVFGPWGVSGSGELATLTFTALLEGISPLEFQKVYLADNHADTISAFGISGIVNVQNLSTEEEIHSDEIISFFPNPFSKSTKISFSLQNPNSSNVHLKIYNLKGQFIKEISSRSSDFIQSVQWDGRDENNMKVENGIYFFRLETNNETLDIRKGILLR
ncbi:MAG: T9SS type A sorting domain-containing protein, partial [Candidatus Cloacimonadota bacterium]|nr:T9SS type A sorting domain-containing protein [Candidatus Cloacimonadota bacterium]